MEIGILLDAGRRSPDELMDWAAAADARGIGVAVVTRTSKGGEAPWSPWTVATWIVGRTARIRVGSVPTAPRGSAFGVSAPAPAPIAPASLIDKARPSLSALEPDRVLETGRESARESRLPPVELAMDA